MKSNNTCLYSKNNNAMIGLTKNVFQFVDLSKFTEATFTSMESFLILVLEIIKVDHVIPHIDDGECAFYWRTTCVTNKYSKYLDKITSSFRLFLFLYLYLFHLGMMLNQLLRLVSFRRQLVLLLFS